MTSWQVLLRRAVSLGGRKLREQLQPREQPQPPREQRPGRSSSPARQQQLQRPAGPQAMSSALPEIGPGTQYPHASPRPAGNATRFYHREMGAASFSYQPLLDGNADPGEVVWTWVPYQEDDRIGKDRPVLVVGKIHSDAATQTWLLCAQMTSKDHQLDAQQEAAAGRHWCAIGVGSWDRLQRPSAVRVDRLLQVAANDVRREGATLAKPRFDDVIAAIERFWD